MDSDGEDYVFSEIDEEDDDWRYLCTWFPNMIYDVQILLPATGLTYWIDGAIYPVLTTKQFFLETTIYLWRFTLCCNPKAGNVVSQYCSQSMEMWF